MHVLKLRAVSEKTGLKSSAIYQRIAQGTFPRQVKLGPKASGWIESEIDFWIADRIRERDAKHSRREACREDRASNNVEAR